MLKEYTGKVRILVGRTDLRLGLDGLAAIVKSYNLSPFDGSLYLFCGRKRDRIKGLLWDGNDGFLLLYKRLEESVYQWPRNTSEAMELTPQQYRWLTEGLCIDQPKAHKDISGYDAIN